MTPRKTMLAQLAEREEQVAAARVKVIEIEEQARQSTAEADRLREVLVEAYASDDKAQVEKLVRAKAKADLAPPSRGPRGSPAASGRPTAGRPRSTRGASSTSASCSRRSRPRHTPQPKPSGPRSPRSRRRAGAGTRCGHRCRR
jgi:hypothetical protein